MADGAASPPPPPASTKKLPFKPTALRKTSLPRLASSDGGAGKHDRGHGRDDDDDEDDDGLALFRRAKEMAPIVAAERERRLKRKKQRSEEGPRRQSDTPGKQPLGRHADDDADGAPPSATPRHADLDHDERPPGTPVSALNESFRYARVCSLPPTPTPTST